MVQGKHIGLWGSLTAIALCLPLFCGIQAQAREDHYVGIYKNESGTVTVKKSSRRGSQYDLLITDNEGKCNLYMSVNPLKIDRSGAHGLSAAPGEKHSRFVMTHNDEYNSLCFHKVPLPFDEIDKACAVFNRDNCWIKQ